MAKQPSNKEFPKKTTNIRQASDTEQVLFQRTENLLENIEQTIVGALSNIFFGATGKKTYADIQSLISQQDAVKKSVLFKGFTEGSVKTNKSVKKDKTTNIETQLKTLVDNLQKLSRNAINSAKFVAPPKNLAEVRAGRANPNILNKVTVDYYGVPTPINQMAGVSVPEPRMIVIQPWDMSMLKEIEKAINLAELGINPMNDGKVIRLTFPELTEERRKSLVKDIRKTAEEAKVAVRSIRRDGIDTAKTAQKNGEMTEDELSVAEAKIQKMTDANIAEIDQILEKKEKEIMTV